MVADPVSIAAFPYLQHQGDLSSTALAKHPQCRHEQEARLAFLLSCLVAGSCAPVPPEPAPLCCSVKLHGPLSQVLQPERGRDSSLVLMTPPSPLGPVLLLLQVVGDEGVRALPLHPLHLTADQWQANCPSHSPLSWCQLTHTPGQLCCTIQSRCRAYSPECCSS